MLATESAGLTATQGRTICCCCLHRAVPALAAPPPFFGPTHFFGPPRQMCNIITLPLRHAAAVFQVPRNGPQSHFRP
jgi:hypothetical protein